MEDFKGYRWGWILDDGTREPTGHTEKTIPSLIIGIWGSVQREGFVNPFYLETFLAEYTKNATGSWNVRPLTMLQDLNRVQAMRMAYAETYGPSNEIHNIAEPSLPPTRQVQKWECESCGHTFYSPVDKTGAWYLETYKVIIRFITKTPLRIECEACLKFTAKKVKVITKPVRE